MVTLSNLLMFLEVGMTLVIQWRDELTPRIVHNKSVCTRICKLNIDNFWLQISKEQLPKETLSTLFTAHEDDDESNCDLTMDFSPDNSRDWGHLTSTPIKLDDTSTLVSDASSPISFLSPNFPL